MRDPQSGARRARVLKRWANRQLIRARRAAPATDRKHVAAWNGYVVSGLARAASVLDVNRGGAGYSFDGKVSGGGIDTVGTTYATVANAAKINGNLTIGDHIAEVQGQGTMAPGASSNLANIATAGDALGHIYTNGNLTINGPLVGTASTAVDRLALQITTATVNATTLGAFDYTATWLTTNAAN